MDENINQNQIIPKQKKNIMIKVTEKIYNRVDSHVRILKHLAKYEHSKNSWIVEAVREKLEREKKLKNSNIPKDKNLNLTVDVSLDNELQRQIDIIKTFKPQGFSKKQFVLEAIFEKLEAEEPQARELIDQVESKED